MKSFLYVVLPGALAQMGEPLMLYNGGTPGTANCAAKTSACDCHYASCSLSGDCACGWDESTLTCRLGATTKCASCPAMRRCSVREKLIIGPDGFPVPGQLSVWGKVPYPDQSGSSAQAQVAVQGQMSRPQVQGEMSRPQVFGQQAQTWPQAQPVQTWPQAQPAQTWQPAQTSQQAQPVVLYQNNMLSARGCTAKTNACDCHYASCTETGDCACGWDEMSKTCRAGIPTRCESCPSMKRCGVSQKLQIGPDGFPVPGQLSVWGNVPYPDQQVSAPMSAPIMSQASWSIAPAEEVSWNIAPAAEPSWNIAPAQEPNIPLQPVQTGKGKAAAAAVKGKAAGKAAKGKAGKGKASAAVNQTSAGM